MHDWDMFKLILSREKERKQKHKENIRDALAVTNIPSSADLRDAVATLFITDALEVLRAHPGFDIESKIASIRTALQLFDQAFADLTSALNAFDLFSRRPEFGYRSHLAQINVLETRIRKEVFAYSELGHSLQDHCRRLHKRWVHPELKRRVTSSFGNDGLHDFICGLRAALHHLTMVESNWLIRNSGPSATSHFVFSRDELKAVKSDWNVRALHYLNSCTDEVDVSKVARDYHLRVHAFYDWLVEEADTAPPSEVIDYRLCLNTHRQHSARAHWRLFLNEFLKRKVDPYAYLEKYLTPPELETALNLARGSPEQVDFVISAVDEFDACNEEIRALVYRLFGVNA